MSDTGYLSSEELQHHNHDVFENKQIAAREKADRTEKDKLHAVLDKYIGQHNTTKAVRERIAENGQQLTGDTLAVQFEVSDAITAILTKIKNELR